MSETIKFMLNGEVREVSGLSPTTTILQYLRLHERLTGTKEGCAEGDCGACTVIVGEIVEGRVSYQSVNACIIFLPTMDGRHIITVEHLKMNPVQKAMVECHGSQCGFCTPGFVMSLTCLMNNTANANDEDIQDAIAGNLCRCTGYRPILDAARLANKSRDRALATDLKQLQGLQRQKMHAYEDKGKKFFSPRTVDELLDVLAQYPSATILAGGTDIGLWVTKFHQSLDVLVYTGNIRALKEIRSTKAGLEIGAAVSYTKAFEALAAYDGSMGVLLRRFASTQIRNQGTVGGNIANGSPIGDGMPPLIALGAKIVLRSKAGARTIPLEEFFLAYKKQDRKQGEIVETVIVPAKRPDALFRTYKLSKRFDQDISAVCGAFALVIKDGKVAEARFAFGGMAATPKRAVQAEKSLLGKPWNETSARQAMVALAGDFKPLGDMRASAAYRATAAANMIFRFFLETTEPQTETTVYNYGT